MICQCGGQETQTAVSISVDSEQVKNVVNAFLTLFPTRSREKNNHITIICYILWHFTAWKSYEHTIFPLPWQNLLWTKQCNCVLFIHLHIYVLYRGKTQGKALSSKGFYVSNIWKILHSVCTRWIPNLSTHIWEKFPQDSPSLFERNTLFSSEPIHIFATYADCSSLEILQYHLVVSKDFPELKPPIGPMILNKTFMKWQV